METILITGINGYLGSTLAKRYSKKYKIVGLEYSNENLFRLTGLNFEVFESKDGIPDKLFEKYSFDFVIHAATFYGREQESDSKMLYANTYLPQMLLEKLTKNGCKLFINTDTVLNQFISSYALTKKQFKNWLEFYAAQSKIKVVNLQLEHFYGPGTANTNFITLMVQKMLQNEPVIALTKAEQNRDFLFIDDLVRVYDLILNNFNDFTYFEEFNVGAGENTNLKEILEFIKENTQSKTRLEYGAIPYRINELMESNNDISRLKKLGWMPKTNIKEGLSNVINFEKKIL